MKILFLYKVFMYGTTRVHSYGFVLRNHVHTHVYYMYTIHVIYRTIDTAHTYQDSTPVYRIPRYSCVFPCFLPLFSSDSLFTAFYYVMDLKLREVRIGATAPQRRTIVESRMESVFFRATTSNRCDLY